MHAWGKEKNFVDKKKQPTLGILEEITPMRLNPKCGNVSDMGLCTLGRDFYSRGSNAAFSPPVL